MRRRIVAGPRSNCPPRRSGKRRPGAPMAERIRGGMNRSMAAGRTIATRGVNTIGRIPVRMMAIGTRHQWALSRRGRAPMVSTTWRVTSGSGCGIGTMRRITAGARSATRRTRRRRNVASGAVAGGYIDAALVRAAHRSGRAPAYRRRDVGFRCVVEVSAPRSNSLTL